LRVAADPRGVRRGERGQAAAELVAVLPCAAAVLALAWQLVLAGETLWAASAAVRAAARAAAVGGDPAAAARAHLPARLEHGLTVEHGPSGRTTVRLRIPSVAGIVLGHVTAEAEFAGQEAP
jgi:pilus assembly protein CpaE